MVSSSHVNGIVATREKGLDALFEQVHSHTCPEDIDVRLFHANERVLVG